MSGGMETIHFHVCLDIQVFASYSCTKPIASCLSHVIAQDVDFLSLVSP